MMFDRDSRLVRMDYCLKNGDDDDELVKKFGKKDMIIIHDFNTGRDLV